MITVTDEMAEAGARALDPDAFAEYDRHLSYRASMEDEETRRKFADHYDERPEAIRKARLVLQAALSLPSPPVGEIAKPVAWLRPRDIARLACMEAKGAISAQIANIEFMSWTTPVYAAALSALPTPPNGGAK